LAVGALCLQACHQSYAIKEGAKPLNAWTEKELTDSFPIGQTTFAQAEAKLGPCPYTNFMATELLTANGEPERGEKFCVWSYVRGRGYKGSSVVFPSPPARYSASKRISLTFSRDARILQKIQVETFDPTNKTTRTVVISSDGRWENVSKGY
jgi:hypothetical protein